MRDHLRKKGLAEELIEPVLARLRRAGLVDDEAFARFWVENRETFRPKGRIALGAELRLKGLSREVIDRALGGLDEDEAASRTAMKQAARYRGLGWPEFRAKLGGYLLRRGFTYETISPIVERAWQAVNGASPGDEFPD
ncbi:MAG: RecX family transcriptional regulator [Chloroflexi bacterium]|nr:RecX family transcriptional regulator [Chloroflexota bacterium]